MIVSEQDAIAFRRFRDQAYQVNPVIGKIIDSAIISETGLGEGTSFASILDKIANGVKTASETMTISYKEYLDTMTQVQYMQQAQKAGVPIDVYMQTVGQKNAVGAFLSDVNSPTPTVAGIPVWLIVGGVLLVVLLKK